MSAPADAGGAGWRIVLALVLVGTAVGFGWGIADRPVYRGTATVVVASDSQGADAARLGRFAERGESETVARRAAAILGRDVPGADLLADVSVEPAADGGYLIVSADSEAPDVAAAAADGFARALVAVEGEPLELGAAAAIPTDPVADRPAGVWAGIGALAGLIGGLIVVAATRRRGGRRAVPPAGPAPAPPWTPAPVNGRLVELGGDPLTSGFAGRPEIAPAAAAAAAMLADRLEVRSAAAPRTLVIVPVGSAGPAAELAVVLAIAAAGAGRRALVVEAGLTAPELAGRLDVAAAPGLSEYLAGAAAPREVLRTVAAEPAGFACIPAGAETAGDRVSGSRFAALAARLARAYDLVIHLAPALDQGSPSAAVAALGDDVVVAAGPDADAGTVDRTVAALGGEPLVVRIGAPQRIPQP